MEEEEERKEKKKKRERRKGSPKSVLGSFPEFTTTIQRIFPPQLNASAPRDNPTNTGKLFSRWVGITGPKTPIFSNTDFSRVIPSFIFSICRFTSVLYVFCDTPL